MFLYSTYMKAVFWIVMGLIYALVIIAAPIWAEDLGLQMTWWKWLLAAAWYILLSVIVAAGSTLIGEKEPGAGYYMLVLSLIVVLITGFGLWMCAGPF